MAERSSCDGSEYMFTCHVASKNFTQLIYANFWSLADQKSDSSMHSGPTGDEDGFVVGSNISFWSLMSESLLSEIVSRQESSTAVFILGEANRLARFFLISLALSLRRTLCFWRGTPCTFFRCLPKLPLYVKVFWHLEQLKGLEPVCFLK